MKYLDAVKIYNQGKPACCSPRKGSAAYKAVIAIMKGDRQSTPLSAKKSSLAMAKILSKKPSSKSLLFKKANVIQRFLKNKLILTKNNLDTRVQRYNLIKKRFNDVPSNYCLKRKY